jgi:hypothetical protein
MDDTQLKLLAEVPGLEAAQRAITARLDEIRRILTGIVPAAPAFPLNSAGFPPGILGRDTLGRIIRKRKLSPEVKENRRKLIAAAREKKYQKQADLEARAAQGKKHG